MSRLTSVCSVRRLIVAAALTVVFGVYGVSVTASAAPSAAKPHWVQVKSPDAGLLYSVSCTSPSFCMAVGYANNGDDPVAEVWNGKAWKSKTPAAPAGSTSALLEGVSCVSAHACVAVGGYGKGSDYLPLAEQWNGSSWKRLTTSSALGSSSSFTAVSCPSAGNCWAVGAASGKPLAEHLKGRMFSIVSMAAKGQDDQVNGISCRAGTCIAVGGDSAGALIERSPGKGFSAVRGGKTPKNTVGDLSAISCVSAKYCVATGESDADKGGAIQTLSEVYKGRGFATVATPDPTHLSVPYNGFYGVSCTSATNCWASGEGGAYAFGGPNLTAKDRSTIAAHWNGKHWSLAASVNPANKPTGFLGLSCSRKTSCQAVGLRDLSTQQTLIEKLTQ